MHCKLSGLLTSCALLALAGCGELERSNPYDPSAPVERQATATVRGSVRLESSGDHGGALVNVAGTSLTAPTGADGSFTLTGLRAGTHVLTVTKDGFRRATRAGVTVGVGQTIDVGEVELARARGLVRGQLSLRGAADHGGATVSLQSSLPQARETGGEEQEPPRAFATLTSSSGVWEIDEVPAGQYFLLARKDGFQPLCAGQVTIVEDGEQRSVGLLELVSSSALVRFATRPGLELEPELFAGELRTFARERALLARFTASGAVRMRLGFSEQSLQAAAFEPFAVEAEVEIPEGEDGEKRLYLELEDQCHLVQAYSAALTLDRAPPSPVAVEIAGGADHLTEGDGTAAVRLVARDALSGVRSMRLTADGSDPAGAPLQEYVGELVLPLGADEGQKTVRALFYDGAGNPSAEAADGIVKDSLPPVLGSPAIRFAGLAPGAVHSSLLVSLEFAFDGELPAQMAVGNTSGTEAGPWQPFRSPLPWALAPGGDGQRSVYARFRDAAGNATAEVEASLEVDLTAPQAPQVIVEDGAAFTGRESGVALSLRLLDGGAGTEMLLSNCPDFCTGAGCQACCHTLAGWTPHVPEVADWSFAGCADGPRVVYAQFRDRAGNLARAQSAPITLDRAPPSQVGVQIADGAAWLTEGDGSAPVRLTARDAISGVATVRLTIDGSDPAAAEARPFVEELVLPLGAEEGTKTVRALFYDGAGNVSTEAADTIVKDTVAPVPGAPAIRFAGQDSGGAVAGLQVVLEFAFDGEAPAQLAVSNYAGTEAGPWQSFRTPLPWALLPGADGTRTVYARFRDAAGNATDELEASVRVDLTAPQSPVVLVEGDAAYTNRETGVSLTLLVDDPDPGTELLLSNCPDFCSGAGCDPCCSTLAGWIPYEPIYASWGFAGCADGQQTVFAKFRDAAGNESFAAHDSIRLDRAPPSIATFTVQSDAPATSSVSVLLTTGASEPADSLKVSFVEAADCAAVDFTAAQRQALTEYTTFLLSSGDGRKTVCARLEDEAGNASAAAGDSIFLDTQPPFPPVIRERGGLASGTSYSLSLIGAASDPAPSSAASASQLVYQVRGGLLGDWTPAAAPPFSFELRRDAALPASDPRHDGEYRLEVRLVDPAGNASVPAGVTVTRDSTAPRAPYLHPLQARAGTVTARWSPSTSGDVHHYLVYYGNYPGQHFGTFAPQGSSPIVVPAGALEARLSGGADLSTVYVAVSAVDETGLESPLSNERSATVYDTSPRLLGFAGGKAYSAATADEQLFVRTALGVEAYRLADPAVPARLSSYYAPVHQPLVEQPDAITKGRLAAHGGFLYLVQRDLVEVVAYGPQGVAARATTAIAFPEGRFVDAAIGNAGGATLLHLAGPGAVAVYDVSLPAAPELLGEASGLDTFVTVPAGAQVRRHLDWLELEEADFGGGPRRVLYALERVGIREAGNDWFAESWYLTATDVTEPAAQAPRLLGVKALAGAPRSLSAVGPRIFVNDGRWFSMTSWISTLDFDGTDFHAPRPECEQNPWDTSCFLLGIAGSSQVGRLLAIPGLASVPGGADTLLVELEGGAHSLALVDLSQSPPAVYAEGALADVGSLQHLSLSGADLVGLGAKGELASVTMPGDGTLTPASTEPARPAARLTFTQGPISCSNPFDCPQPSRAIHAEGGTVLLAGAAEPAGWPPAPVSSFVELALGPNGEARLVRAESALGGKRSSLRRVGGLAVANAAFDGGLSALYRDDSSLNTWISGSSHLAADGSLLFSSNSGQLDVFALAGDAAAAPRFDSLATCSFADGAVTPYAMSRSTTDGNVYVVAARYPGVSFQKCALTVDPASGAHGCGCTPLGDFPAFTRELLARPPYFYYLDQNRLAAVRPTVTAVEQVGVISFPAEAYRILEAGSYLVVLTKAGSYLVDVSDPTQMKPAGLVSPDFQCVDASVEGTRLYCLTDGVAVFDLATSEAVAWAGTAVETSDAHAFAANGQTGVGIFRSAAAGKTLTIKGFDLKNPSSPRPLHANHLSHLGRGAALSFEVADAGTHVELFRAESSTFELGHYLLREPFEPEALASTWLGTGTGSRDLLFDGASLFAVDFDHRLLRYPVALDGTPLAGRSELEADAGARLMALTRDPTRGLVFAVGFHYDPVGTITSRSFVAAFDGASGALLGELAYSGAMELGAADASFGYCTPTKLPCVAWSGRANWGAGAITLLDVANPAAMAYRSHRLFQSDEAHLVYTRAVAFGAPNELFVAADGANGLSLWTADDSWALTRKASLPADHAAPYYSLHVDAARDRVVAGGDGYVDVFAVVRTGGAPTGFEHRRRIPYAGHRIVGIRKAGDNLYVQTEQRQLRRIALPGGDYDQAVDAGGFGELSTPAALLASDWRYYALDEGGFVTSFQALQAEPPGGGVGFAELPRHQYAPPTRVHDFALQAGRLFACREQNPIDPLSSESEAESRIGFEVLSLGGPGARPSRVGSLDVGCTSLAIAGDLAWFARFERAAGSLGSYTITVADLSDETNPVVLATLGPLASSAGGLDLTAQGRQLFVAFEPNTNANAPTDDGLRLLSFHLDGNALKPDEAFNATGQLGLGTGAVSSVAVSGDRLFVSQEPGQLLIYRLRGPGLRPEALASGAGAYGELDLAGPFGFLMQRVGGIRVLDLR